MNTEHIGVLIARLRKEKGMTQQELAEQLGITDKAVSKWERNLSCPDIAILPQVAEILGVTVDDLLSTPKRDPHSWWKEFNRSDVKEMVSLVCRCVSLALSIGGLVILQWASSLFRTFALCWGWPLLSSLSTASTDKTCLSGSTLRSLKRSRKQDCVHKLLRWFYQLQKSRPGAIRIGMVPGLFCLFTFSSSITG